MTVRKFIAQPDSVKRRHAPRLIHEYERAVCSAANAGAGADVRGRFPDLVRFLSILELQSWLTRRAAAAVNEVRRAIAAGEERKPGDLCRGLNRLRHELLLLDGRASADWDFDASGGLTDENRRDRGEAEEPARRFSIGIYGESIRSPFNVGAIVRCSEAFGASFCAFSDDSAPPDHPRASRSAMGSAEHIPVMVLGLTELVAKGWTVFAVELGGTPVSRFSFPDKAVAIFGNEELGASEMALEAARAGAGIVSIPLYGRKASLNVATATAAVLSWWTASLADRTP
ncbi:MAG: TrmH family RNA methyltransferase [Spirochaetales bacterium]